LIESLQYAYLQQTVQQVNIKIQHMRQVENVLTRQDVAQQAVLFAVS